MNAKKFFKSLPTRIWFIVSCVLVFLLVAVNIAVNLNVVQELSNTLFRAQVIAEGDTSSAQYYAPTATSKEDALARGDALNLRMAEEGITMLKNKDNALPLASGAKISVFGKSSSSIVYGGTGSGAVDASKAKTLFDSLEGAGFSYNPTLKAFYDDNSKSGNGRSEVGNIPDGEEPDIYSGETPISSYSANITNSYANYKDAAIIVISRVGGEGYDLPMKLARDPSRHYLELDADEEALVEHVTAQGFGKVIIMVNAGTSFELGWAKANNKIDGIFLVPGTGTTGILAFGEILAGTVNPSGRTVDTYAADFTANPTWQNFGGNRTNNGDSLLKQDGSASGYFFADYEENVYMGYRYFETRGVKEGGSWFDDNVVYPFGYGLSYTSFKYEFANKGALASSLTLDEFEVEVKVTNTGSKAGKAVVELYGHAPYTNGGIEKSEVQLIGFAKTDKLDPGKSGNVKMKVNPYYLASFDAHDKNGNGFKGYEMEAGDYVFSLRTDSHNVVDSFTKNLPAGIQIAKDPVTDHDVVTRYSNQVDATLNSDGGRLHLMSRSDFAGTYPETSTGDDRKISDALIARLDAKDSLNPNIAAMEAQPVPTMGDVTTNPDLKLYDLFAKDEDGYGLTDEWGHPYMAYDNPQWEALLDKIEFQKLVETLNYCAFKTADIESIDKPATLDTDGPVGWVNFMEMVEATKTFYGTCAYSSEYLIGMTWNKDLLREWGETVGDEGIWGNARGDGRPYTGWYAPGMNLHRSPFGGRNFEYFSEDPYLTGELAANEVYGCRSKGVYAFMKHFAMNEQETHRQSKGDCTFVDEQAMRELYLRPFEIAVKEGKAYGVMTSFNRTGAVWTGGDYRLLTEILRGEWGFCGTIIDDFNSASYMNTKQMIYAGGDINLANQATRTWRNAKEDNAADVIMLRRAMKNLLWTVGNSAAMNGHGDGITYRTAMPAYTVLQIAVDVAIPVIILGWGIPVFLIVRKRPEVVVSEDTASN